MIMPVFAISIILLGLVIGNESEVLEWPDEAISKENGIGRKEFQNIDLIEPKTDLSLVDDEKDSSSLENMANSRLTTQSSERKSRLQSRSINLKSESKEGEKNSGLLRSGFGGMLQRKPKAPKRTPHPNYKHIVTEPGPNGKPVVYIPYPAPGPDGMINYGRVFDTYQNAYIDPFKLFLYRYPHKGKR